MIDATIYCATCGDLWSTALHFCHPPVAPEPDQAETERVLVLAVVEAAERWAEQEQAGTYDMVESEDALLAAVAALQAHRESRS